MSETLFVRFHEYNDHEGESWNWWLQLDGNEEELGKLAELLREVEDDDFEAWHVLHREDVEPEPVVDKLVQYAEDGYHSAHNKVTGTFACPDTLAGDRLYKGRIRDLFEAGPR